MTLLADTHALSLLFKIVAAATLLVVGLRCLWLAHVERSPGLAAARLARTPGYVSPFAKALPQQPVAARLKPGSELRRITAVLEGATSRVQAINAAQVAAARQIDSAEVALQRLLAEITSVMPSAIVPVIVPRRPLTVVSMTRHALAA
jgi:hypothetical protein